MKSKMNHDEQYLDAKDCVDNPDKYDSRLINEAKHFINGYETALKLNGVSKSLAKQYAEFCIICDREGLPLIELDDYLKIL
jgi:hypothetical protein